MTTEPPFVIEINLASKKHFLTLIGIVTIIGLFIALYLVPASSHEARVICVDYFLQKGYNETGARFMCNGGFP